MTCPCDNQCREECELCRDADTIKKGEERMNNITVPREKSERVQAILNDESLSNKEKAKQIYSYDDTCLSREYDRRKPTPSMSANQIEIILDGRK